MTVDPYIGSAGGQPRLFIPTMGQFQDPSVETAMNVILRWANSLLASTPGPPGVSWNWRDVTGNATAAPGDYIVCDGAGSAYVGTITLPSTTSAGQMIALTIKNEGAVFGTGSAISIAVPTGVNLNGNAGPYTATNFMFTRDIAVDPSIILIAASTTDWVILSTGTAMPGQGSSPGAHDNVAEIMFGLAIQGPIYAGFSGFSTTNVSVVDGSEVIVPISGLPSNCVFNTTFANFQLNIVLNNDAAAGNVNLSGGGTYNGPASLAPGHSATFISNGSHTYCIGTY
jgi:hypothetical protein